MRHVVGPGDFPGRFASIAPLQSFAPLVGSKLRLAAHLYTSGFGQLSAFAGTRADQLAFKLSQATQNRQHQPAMGSGGIGPWIAQRPKARLFAADCRHGIEKITGRAGQPIQPGHHQHVAGRKLIERPTQLIAFGFGATGDFSKHLLAPVRFELGNLRRHALAVR